MNIEPLSNLGCAVLTCAKWCPLENCTILVIGKSALEEVKPLEVASFVITSIGIRFNFKSSFFNACRLSVWNPTLRLGWFHNGS